MLDGLLGRGFSFKCKSLIKASRERIEVVRRRAVAKQRFLKEDLAKLLSNGLDINAYGRTEEFLAGMNLLFCYDFIEQSCNYIVKQLSRRQKQGECPEECRQAVASLMFAAARFSDLPELRELRDVFQQRYGNGLEVFVNQKFVEKLSSELPATEKKIQVLQDIASEFSIKWDSRGFEQRMVTPSVLAKVDVQKTDIVKPRPGFLDENNRIHGREEGNFLRRNEFDRHKTVEYREKSLLKKGDNSSSPKGDADILFHGRLKQTGFKHSYLLERAATDLKVERSSSSSHGKMLNNVHVGYTRHSNDIGDPRKVESTEALFREKTEFAANSAGKNENAIPSYDCSNQNKTLNPIRKRSEEKSDMLKSCSNYALPPPYVKSALPPPYTKPKEDKHKTDKGSKDHGSDLEKRSVDPFSCKIDVVNSSIRPPNGLDHPDYEAQCVPPAKAKTLGLEKELDYQGEKISLPKPRSIRRKHHKPPSGDVDDTFENVGSAKRSSSSRRRNPSKKGLQILFDEEHHRKDDEEKIMDKLLIHYSKKPSSYDAGKLRKKLLAQPTHQISTGVGESSLDVVIPPPTRSVSLPHEHTALPETKKVFTRVNTFQPDNQARHVHPKLPDYDDLAARFAALRGR
ncbi:hypothetical protein ACJIZ3_021176 [Penstemon smallii]|uniref:Vacuolar protein sorting-associated protein Ist1 n=1 Tax=Penstemon smallii TaxID=265156 RepID=A0ABD3SL08_9LAMI